MVLCVLQLRFGLFKAFGQRFSVIRRGDTLLFFENAAEIKGIVIAHNGGNFRHIIIGCFQQAYRIVDAEC